MKSFAHIGIFISMRPIKHVKPMCIIGEMRRHPIQYNADTFLMESIDQPHQALWISKTGCGSKETSALITPASIKWMFHHRHQLYMCKAHLFDVRNQSLPDLVIRIV